MFKFQRHANDLTDFYQKRYKVNQMPQIVFKDDEENSKNVLGRTGQYDPHQQIVTIFTTGRHGKDVLRSLAHELIHHLQNERGDLENMNSTEPGYAQNDSHMRNMEREAYEQGNLCLRDWEDHIKTNNIQLYETIYKADRTKGDSVMSIKDQRNVNFHNKLMESWGFSKKGEESKLLTEDQASFDADKNRLQNILNRSLSGPEEQKLRAKHGVPARQEENVDLTEEVDAFMDLNVGWGGGSEVWPKDDTVEDGIDEEVSLEAHSADAEERKVNNKVEETIRRSIRSILKDIVK